MNRLILLAPALFALTFTAPLAAQRGETAAAPNLSMEQTTSLRCAAAFALIADGQTRGDEAALAYPPLGERGREFFVRATARLMDETGLDRAGIAALLRKEAQDIWDKGELDQMMPACLILLEASGV